MTLKSAQNATGYSVESVWKIGCRRTVHAPGAEKHGHRQKDWIASWSRHWVRYNSNAPSVPNSFPMRPGNSTGPAVAPNTSAPRRNATRYTKASMIYSITGKINAWWYQLSVLIAVVQHRENQFNIIPVNNISKNQLEAWFTKTTCSNLRIPNSKWGMSYSKDNKTQHILCLLQTILITWLWSRARWSLSCQNTGWQSTNHKSFKPSEIPIGTWRQLWTTY